MGLFKKKDEVPQLPPAPTLPDLPAPADKKELPELPSFPQSAQNEGLNQELVKSAVSDDAAAPTDNAAPQFPSLPPKDPGMLPPKEVDQPAAVQTIPDLPATTPITQEVGPEPISVDQQKSREIQGYEELNRPVTRSSEPLFVRIDKFQSSQESFNKIVGKVKEIESTLEKIKKVKSREDEEIAKWSSEVEELKSKLGDIDENIFSQI